jgi:hypothetical protein
MVFTTGKALMGLKKSLKLYLPYRTQPKMPCCKMKKLGTILKHAKSVIEKKVGNCVCVVFTQLYVCDRPFTETGTSPSL